MAIPELFVITEFDCICVTTEANLFNLIVVKNNGITIFKFYIKEFASNYLQITMYLKWSANVVRTSK